MDINLFVARSTLLLSMTGKNLPSRVVYLCIRRVISSYTMCILYLKKNCNRNMISYLYINFEDRGFILTF